MIVRRLQIDELYHHGVKGQEWGVKNGPPYPLDAKGRSLKKQQKLMKKQQKDSEKLEKAAQKAKTNFKGLHYKDVQDNHIDAVKKRRSQIENQYYDYKMQIAGGNKEIKNSKEYKAVKKEFRAYRNLDYNWGGRQASLIHLGKCYKKISDKSIENLKKELNENEWDVKKSSEAIERANKILRDASNERISSYGRDSNGNIFVKTELRDRK